MDLSNYCPFVACRIDPRGLIWQATHAAYLQQSSLISFFQTQIPINTVDFYAST